jgi:hypothetical protein
MRLSLLALFAFLFGLIGCQPGVEYTPQNQSQGVSTNEESSSNVEEEQQVQEEQEQQKEDVAEEEPAEEEVAEEVPENTEMTPGEILALNDVVIEGNGDMLLEDPDANAAAFATAYTDPNGKPLNDVANELTLKEGQLFTVCNNGTTEPLRVHTNGEPFPHGSDVDPGQCVAHEIEANSAGFVANANNFYDHNEEAYELKIRVVSDAEAQQIIAAEAAQ